MFVTLPVSPRGNTTGVSSVRGQEGQGPPEPHTSKAQRSLGDPGAPTWSSPPPWGPELNPKTPENKRERKYIHPESKLPITRQNSWEIAWRREILGVLQSTEPESVTARAPWLAGRQPFPEGQWPWPLRTVWLSAPYSSAA